MKNKLIMDDKVAISKARKYFFITLIITIMFVILGDYSGTVGCICLELLVVLCVLFVLIGFVPINRISFSNGMVSFRQTKYRTGPLMVPLKNISYIKVELYLKKWNIINYYHITFIDTAGEQIAVWGSHFWATDKYIDELKNVVCTYGIEVKS